MGIFKTRCEYIPVRSASSHPWLDDGLKNAIPTCPNSVFSVAFIFLSGNRKTCQQEYSVSVTIVVHQRTDLLDLDRDLISRFYCNPVGGKPAHHNHARLQGHKFGQCLNNGRDGESQVSAWTPIAFTFPLTTVFIVS